MWLIDLYGLYTSREEVKFSFRVKLGTYLLIQEPTPDIKVYVESGGEQ